MSLFELLIVQPIFNVLALIYGLLPGADFGVAVILFTVLIRLAMWPLVKKQLHQTRVMRQIQPELKKIKAKAKGNKQLEGQLMMELYRERGVNPLGSIGLLLLQLPIFIALYQVINLITQNQANIAKYTYDFFEGLPQIHAIISNPSSFNESLFRIIDLSRQAIDKNVVYWPVLVLALVAGVLQYIQSRQITPQPANNRRLRDVLKDQAKGKDVDQSEVSAIVGSRTIILFPVLTIAISLYLPGALVLYFVVSSLVAIIQQRIVLGKDEVEMEKIADKPSVKTRILNAQEAEIVESPKPSAPSKKKSRAKRRKG